MTADPTNRPPLWQVMSDAYATMLDGPPASEGLCYAAEIRAIADEVVPEEAEPAPGILPCVWIERMKIRQRLLAEADRAEAGDAAD